MLKLTYGTPREIMSDIVTASFSPSGELIAAVDRQNSMILYKVINNELIPSGERFRLPNSELNQSITDIGFDEACEKVWLAYSGYDSYYANSPGCADCGINASTAPTDTSSLNHLVVIELASGEIRGFANIILVQPLLTVDDDGMLIGHYDFGPRTLGPVPYTYGVYWEKDFIMTVTQEHQGDAYSLSHKIEFWNVRTGMPESLPIRLGSLSNIHFVFLLCWKTAHFTIVIFLHENQNSF